LLALGENRGRVLLIGMVAFGELSAGPL